MPRTFNPEELLTYLGMRWRFLAIACLTALILSVAISLVMTRQYTATVSIVIDPPASSDPRAAMAISPIYLESLRTYESYAEGDSLFAQAVDRFHLRVNGNEASESLRRKILRVSKLKDSKVLQIHATLPDPAKAVAVAQFVAGEVVRLSHQTGAGIDREMLQNAEQQLGNWQSRQQKAADAYAEFEAKSPVEPLQAEIESLQDLASRVHRDALDAEADAEDLGAREKLLSADAHDVEELRGVRQEVAAKKARVAVLQRQAHDLQASLSAKGAELGRRTARRANLEAQVKMAQTGAEAQTRRAGDMQAAAGGRGDVLTIIDPGIVPQRPSSPNVVLNAIVALFVALVLSLLYLVLSFGRSRARNWQLSD
jgi:capsular polysaccharide biosynthesis protein